MKNKFLFLILFLGMIHAQNPYCTGEQISIADQNQEQGVCAGFEDYQIGDDFRLADYNGELNGGNYHVIFIDMSASW